MTLAAPKRLFIEGAITSSKEDVEGNLFDPKEMNFDFLLQDGWLDIDHLYHKYGIQEAIIGKPVAVWVEDDTAYARFELQDNELNREIYDFIRQHPQVLSYSIAGDLEKPLFQRGGKWDVISVGLTHNPMQPNAFAVAKSAGQMTLHGIMSAFAADLTHHTVDYRSAQSLYTYFRGMTDPMLSAELTFWALKKLNPHVLHYNALRAPVDLMSQFRQNLFLPEDYVEGFALDVRAHLMNWRLMHPNDTHINQDGSFNSVEDAVYHLRYCEKLNPIQVAMILGKLRGRGDIIKEYKKVV
jgi:hypothetical protein